MVAGYRTRLIPLLGLFLMTTQASQGATIELSPLDSAKQAVVSVSGRLEVADIDQFRTKTSTISEAIVVFESNGGSLIAGIEIGTLMRLKGFVSLVHDSSRCASACALAWLGGSKRFMGKSAQIGFHAPYVVKDGVPTESSAGNAQMGAYLNRIGVPERAVIYMTGIAPPGISWLDLKVAEQLGIDVSLFEPSNPNARATLSTVTQTTP
jgi:hypothetical protein